jgi:hypothetical protein
MMSCKAPSPQLLASEVRVQEFFFFHLYITNIYLKQEQTRKHFCLDVKLSVPKVGPQVLKGVFFSLLECLFLLKIKKKLIVL